MNESRKILRDHKTCDFCTTHEIISLQFTMQYCFAQCHHTWPPEAAPLGKREDIFIIMLIRECHFLYDIPKEFNTSTATSYCLLDASISSWVLMLYFAFHAAASFCVESNLSFKFWTKISSCQSRKWSVVFTTRDSRVGRKSKWAVNIFCWNK